MSRSARQPDSRASGLLVRVLAFALGALARNPAIAGGTTAFLVALFYVSANAMWYQPQQHSGAFFATRHQKADPVEPAAPRAPVPAAAPAREDIVPPPDTETTGAVPEPAAQPEAGEQAMGDPTVRHVQSVLRELDLYDGEIDGLSGPRTHAAIRNYRRIVGLDDSGEIDDRLLGQLGIEGRSDERSEGQTLEQLAATEVPEPSPRPSKADRRVEAAASAGPDPLIKRIQAGLRAFGNDDIQIDGVVGDNTRAAILEFQSLFGLPETGEADSVVLAKMQEIGLTN